MNFPNNAIIVKAITRRDIFVHDGAHPTRKPETLDPRETFPVLAGTVMARATDSKLLIRYVDPVVSGVPADNGNDVVVGMLYDEIRQLGASLEVGAPPSAMPCDLVIHGIAINANGIANLTPAAVPQLFAMGVYPYTDIV